MKLVFMGTPDFAVGALEALIEAGHEITAVVTQPDKPKGRGKEMQYPPVKECALRHGIEVFQPVKIKAPEAVETLRTYEAELFVVAAFGQILSQEILDMPKYGCINIHASLLPKYRGAAPIQWAILDGEPYTGVTIMQMNAGMDTGDILTNVQVPITPEETGDSLFDKLCIAGAKLCVDTIPLIEQGKLTPRVQNEAEATYAGRLSKTIGRIDWQEDARVIERKVRGLNSWPSAYTTYHGKQMKIWSAAVADTAHDTDEGGRMAQTYGKESYLPGTITDVTKDCFTVRTGNGDLIVREVQLEGKKRMSVRDFLLGYAVTVGEMIG